MNAQAGNQRSEIVSAPRLPLAGYILLGLCTCWLYTVLALYRKLYRHMQERWHELGDYIQPGAHITLLYQSGFHVPVLPFLTAGFLYSLAAVLCAGLAYWVLNFREHVSLEMTAGIVGLLSLAAYLATLVFLLSVSRTLRVHEIAEGFLHRVANGQPAMPDAGLPGEQQRWDSVHNKIALYLVVTLPVVFLPTIVSYLVTSHVINSIDDSAWLLYATIVGFLHAWGTAIVVGMVNSHFAREDEFLVRGNQG
jgi:hypothetical protein